MTFNRVWSKKSTNPNWICISLETKHKATESQTSKSLQINQTVIYFGAVSFSPSLQGATKQRKSQRKPAGPRGRQWRIRRDKTSPGKGGQRKIWGFPRAQHQVYCCQRPVCPLVLNVLNQSARQGLGFVLSWNDDLNIFCGYSWNGSQNLI